MKKVFCCYLDVLGFKQKLLSKSDSEQADIIKSLFSYLVSSIPENLIRQFSDNIDKAEIDLESINTNSILISDSIILWTESCEYQNVIEFIHRVQRLMRNCFVGGFPLRGTISYGSLFHNEKNIASKTYNHFDLIVGPALMNAYKAEINFEWMGCTLDSECFEQITKIITQNNNSLNFEIDNLFKENIIVKYMPPRKCGDVETLYTINWVDLIIQGLYNKREIQNQFMKNINSTKLTWQDKRKIDNTNSYISFIIQQNLVCNFIATKVQIR
ncbi:MAG TPA: hypothetical protein PKC62_09390 [Ferruginibacter sp.]|nr:hypothetical protein [Ferruginibacter sp.]MBS1908288.1 hypothetical protein [Bacteroidota bacterium]MBS1925675.1 hypothetical protein [Bacteroidota bacterium]HMT96888.1 hypothetical protein [Ferruginibacter sp.]HMU24001.1 hypothetical protein [Ferruginibacter sp.]